MTEPAATPAWLLQPQFGLCPCGCIGRRRKGTFVAKTLNGAATLMRQTMFSSDVASAPGLLQRVEPRVKLLTVLGLTESDAEIEKAVEKAMAETGAASAKDIGKAMKAAMVALQAGGKPVDGKKVSDAVRRRLGA